MQPFISVIIPCRNEERYISRCLESIFQTSYPVERMEILIVDGASEDKTSEIIKTYIHAYPFIKLLTNPKKITPVALNIAIAASKGDYIIRLDAHTYYPPDYFSQLIGESMRLNAENVGCIWITDVLHKTPVSISIRNVLRDPLGVGNALFRIGITETMQVDTVPFGCFRRDVFTKYGLFDERLVRNQDIEFNKRIVRGGGTIYLIAGLSCIYYARESYRELASNNYQNGYWNILTPYYTGTFSSLSLRHFVPLVFVLSLILPILLSMLYPFLLWIW
ncbi:glycosyltransferase family 2 protein, partial [Sulfuricurvum sp.]|uniref:glycosyltransferase family 2 protein n=1 Tax=Sulfuricurvum sp. TaxID=2025608 RepID=UPI00261EE91A